MNKYFGNIQRLVFLGGCLVMTAGASSAPFSISPYNALVFGNFTDTYTDFGGGVAAAGNLTISGTAVADALLSQAFSQFPGGYTLVSGDNLNATNGQVAEGNVYGGGSVN